MIKTKKVACLATLACAAGAFGATVTVVAPQEGAAKEVTVGASASAEYAEGALAPLKAVANAGWSFAGWYSAYDAGSGEFSGEVALAQSADWRTASANYVVGDADATLYARFVKPADDTLSFDFEAVFTSVAVEVDDADRPVLSMTEKIDAVLPVESASFPAVSVTGLPSGLAFDAKSLRLLGTPTVPGVYRVSASAKNVSGYPFSQVFYVRVENAASEHVSGSDSSDYSVGSVVDTFLDEFFDVSNTNSAVKSIGVTGLPAGLLLESDVDDYYVRGKLTKSGDYTVWCTVKFSDGTVEKASMLFTVGEPDPYDYGVTVDFSVLNGYCVGDSILIDEESSIGEYDSESGTGVIAVSGLPAGISAVRSAAVGGYSYILSGVFTKAGEYAVSVKVAYDDWENETIAVATLSRKIIVDDSPGTYVFAAVLDEEAAAAGCKVAGGGVYSSGATAKLAATAGSGYVFSGWCDFAGIPVACGADDYRKSPASVIIGEGAELEWYAAFIPKADDHVGLDDLADAEMTVDPASGEPFAYSFAVASGSLPTLKFSNLPAWLACAPSSEVAGDYVLSYNPATSKTTPMPGRYRVAATATNLSRMSDTASFLVVVPNWTDDDIHVVGDYGVLAPNVAMEPISLSNAVDFARGDTLAVTGLPAGLKYNDRATPYCLSGTPTKPGEYTLKFTAKIVAEGGTRTATATAYIKVKDFPTVAVDLSDEAKAAGNKVTGAGSFKAGTKIALKAVAAKDWVFAGWGEGSGATGLAALNPSLAYVMGSDDLVEIGADFIHRRDDLLFVDDPGVVAVVKGAAFSTNLVETIIETRSLPTVSVSGLPNGLKFDAKTFAISGTVGKTAKAGYCYATAAAKNASGYTFTRVLKFVVLESAGDPIPDEPVLPNEAGIDFSDLDTLVTGGFCPAGGAEAIGFAVDPSESGSDVAAVSVSGLPSGLKSVVSIEDGAAEAVLFGTPNKPGRCEVKVQVTYADRKKATSQYAFIVEDGGSAWLDVESFDASMGTVSGAGVYASGAAVKLSAKPVNGKVFAGWYEDEDLPFDVIATTDGVDYRTAAAAFLFRKGMFDSASPVLFGGFVAKTDDTISIDGPDDVWEIVPSESGELPFTVNSASLPKLTASGLPKGVTLDAAAGKFAYSPSSQAQVAPGFYTITLKAANQSNASASAKFSVFVANKTTEAIGGLDPDADAYPLSVGVALDPDAIAPEIDTADGWKLAVAGLPAGLKFDAKSGTIGGVATKAGTNTVTFTATRGREKEVATITVCVAALPAWACGTYDGAYFTIEDGVTNAVGSVNLTVSAAGKVSGKILRGGKSYSFSAAAFDGYDAGSFTANVTVPWSTADKETFVLSVDVGESGLGFATLEPLGDGAYFAEAVQNAWLRKDLPVPEFATGNKQPTLQLDDLVCKFGAKGVVTLSGKIGVVNASGKAQTLACDYGGKMNANVMLYVANAKFEGGAFCEFLSLILSDEDGDGKLDTVVVVPE